MAYCLSLHAHVFCIFTFDHLLRQATAGLGLGDISGHEAKLRTHVRHVQHQHQHHHDLHTSDPWHDQIGNASWQVRLESNTVLHRVSTLHPYHKRQHNKQHQATQ